MIAILVFIAIVAGSVFAFIGWAFVDLFVTGRELKRIELQRARLLRQIDHPVTWEREQ